MTPSLFIRQYILVRWHSTLQQDDKDGARMFEDRDPELQWWCRMMMVNGSLHVDCLLQLVWQSQWRGVVRHVRPRDVLDGDGEALNGQSMVLRW